MFAAMAAEEDGHRHRLLDLYPEKFGDHIPLIRRQDVKGFLERKSLWLARPLGLEKVRAQAELMEAESKRFYQRAARQSTDAAIRQLLGDLANPARLDGSGGPVDNDVEQYGLRSG
jgi:rubrerythrin